MGSMWDFLDGGMADASAHPAYERRALVMREPDGSVGMIIRLSAIRAIQRDGLSIRVYTDGDSPFPIDCETGAEADAIIATYLDWVKGASA